MSADTARSAAAHGRHGAVAAGHPLAADVALDVLRRGGNAIDAAIAGSAMQCVVELPWCGMAGDAFAMVRSASGEVIAYNGSGAAPQHIGDAMGTAAQVPRHGPLPVGVPGIVDTWVSVAERFGSWPLATLLAPAVSAAQDGVALDPRLQKAFASLASEGGDASLLEAFAIDPSKDRAIRLPDLAASLQAVVEQGRDGFYTGRVAEQIATHLRGLGGAMTVDDLAAHRGTWARPISVRFRDSVVHVQPPVSMGALLCCALRIVERFAPDRITKDIAARTDALVVAKHAVFQQALPLLGDPAFVEDATTVVLSDAWIDALPNVAPAATVAGGGSDTTSIAVTDAAGNSISFIHSLFNEFGARVLVPGTGLVLNDRLANLRTDPRQRNALQGGKRPMHTLHSYLVERDGGTVLAGCTPGGRGQVQTNLQVLLGVIDDGLAVADAVARPRWVNGLPRRAPDDDTLYLEWNFDPDAAAELARSGHRVEFMPADSDDHFGACTIVENGAEGCRAAADHRRDCAAVAW